MKNTFENKLDSLLKYLSKKEVGVEKEPILKDLKLNDLDYELCYKKLIVDNYIQRTYEPNKYENLKIKPTGLHFIENGGYSASTKRNRNTLLISIIALIVAFLSLLVALIPYINLQTKCS